MGIVNVTPDSFSDGGLWLSPDAAIEHAHDLVRDGADIVDIGGESTRPRSTRISADEEWKRIGPVVSAVAESGIVVSVDTMHATTAARAAEAGAALINDISGGRMDPHMNKTVADTGCAYVIQHWRALPGTPEENFDYGKNLIDTLKSRILTQVEDALNAGVAEESVIIDPGLGFSLTNKQSWRVVNALECFHSLGYPVLIGASRKRFLSDVPGDRDETTVRVTADAARSGVWAVRVHNVAANVAAILRGESEDRL
ncbi:MAG: dihydropteroate synthase [Actinobacteria bacterium]|nr:MAG: dihydropteroate synthase [Actinomycetota bacterium]